MNRIGITVAVAAALLLLASGCQGKKHTSGSGQQASAEGLTDLRGLGDLRAVFNSRSGEPRLILLASPT
jgi:hypothetical protein